MGSRLKPEARPAPLPCDSSPHDTCACVGDELRRMYDDIVVSPMPQSLLDLCDALEDAFHRGDLQVACTLRTPV